MKIVVSNNSHVYDELAGDGFSRVHAESVVVSSGDEALAAARRERPDLLVLDADLPGLDGYTVTEAVKSDPALKAVRVILVLQGAISGRQLQRLATCGCDDVLVYRQPGETLYSRAARLLGLPDNTLAEPVKVRVSIGTHTHGDEVSAHALRLSPTAVDLLAPEPMPIGSSVRVRLRRDTVTPPVEVAGAVTSVETDGPSGSPLLTVSFDGLSLRDRARIADLALWEVRPLAEEERPGMRLTFRGRFDEGTDFSGVRVDGAQHIVFDTCDVRAINSWGARKWILFLRSMPAELTYAFINASSTFIKHCNMVADMLGRGEVISFAAPYECEGCGVQNERVLQASAMTPSIIHAPPEFRCSRCGGVEIFDDVPGRYFAFLGGVDA